MKNDVCNMYVGKMILGRASCVADIVSYRYIIKVVIGGKYLLSALYKRLTDGKLL